MSKLVRDIAERVLATFVGAFVAVFSVADLSSAKTAAVAGAAAALALLKGLIAQYVGQQSASLDPAV